MSTLTEAKKSPEEELLTSLGAKLDLTEEEWQGAIGTKRGSAAKLSRSTPLLARFVGLSQGIRRDLYTFLYYALAYPHPPLLHKVYPPPSSYPEKTYGEYTMTNDPRSKQVRMCERRGLVRKFTGPWPNDTNNNDTQYTTNWIYRRLHHERLPPL